MHVSCFGLCYSIVINLVLSSSLINTRAKNVYYVWLYSRPAAVHAKALCSILQCYPAWLLVQLWLSFVAFDYNCNKQYYINSKVRVIVPV